MKKLIMSCLLAAAIITPAVVAAETSLVGRAYQVEETDTNTEWTGFVGLAHSSVMTGRWTALTLHGEVGGWLARQAEIAQLNTDDPTLGYTFGVSFGPANSVFSLGLSHTNTVRGVESPTTTFGVTVRLD